MLNGFEIANKDTITLDSTNNVIVGPNGYFKVVIDSFDGTTVKAWHVEDPKGNKTDNLAAAAQGKHIDLMLGKGNRDVDHFLSRYADRIASEAAAAKTAADKAAADAKAKTEADLAAAKADLAKAQADVKAAQDKLAAAEKTAKDLQGQLNAKANLVDPMVPIGVGVVGVLALVGLYLGLRRKPS
jgi:hypothetical protein